jgi:hypothetical protein
MHAAGDHPTLATRFHQHDPFGGKQQLALGMMMRGIHFATRIANRPSRPADGIVVNWRFVYNGWHFVFLPSL